MPATTALTTLGGPSGRDAGLACGANVVMPNLTPSRYRALYEIYPGKAGIREEIASTDEKLRQRLQALGRPIAAGPGTSPNYLARMPHQPQLTGQRTGGQSTGVALGNSTLAPEAAVSVTTVAGQKDSPGFP